MSDKEQKASAKVPTFTKEQLLNSKKFQSQRDLINALIEDGKSYTMAEVDKKIKNYLDGKVE